MCRQSYCKETCSDPKITTLDFQFFVTSVSILDYLKKKVYKRSKRPTQIFIESYLTKVLLSLHSDYQIALLLMNPIIRHGCRI